MKKFISVVLSIVMLISIMPCGVISFAADTVTELKLTHYGSSGDNTGTGILVATGVYPSATGTESKAPYIAGDTGSHMTNLGSTRIGVMAFSADGVDADAIKKATLNVYVNAVNANIGTGWMRFAVYETENPTLTYSSGGMDQSLFAAKDGDYSYDAAMWSNEKFTYSGTEGVTAGWATVDVTDAVKNAAEMEKDNVVLRFQVPSGGLNLSVAGDYAPSVELVTGDKVEVKINCVDENGTLIKTTTEYAVQGASYTSVADTYISLNETVYTITGDTEKTVTVSESGNEITFTYTNVEEDVLAKYKFEDSSFAQGVTVKDSSSNGYDATVAGGDLGQTIGVFNNALNLNKNGYIELPAALLTALKGKTQFTINAYVKKNELQNQFLFSASKAHKGSNGTSIGIIDSQNYRYEGNGDKVTTGTRTTVDTEYTALTAVFDYEAGTMVLYTDGVQAGSGSLTKTLTDVNAEVMGIGVSPWNDPYYNGYVDNFTIFGSALSVEDVKKIAGKITVTPVYADYENNRTYYGETVTARPGEVVEFEKSIKDEETYYNYTAKYEDALSATVNYSDEGSYEYVIECTSEKNAAYEIVDLVNIGGDCSEDNITLPSKVNGYNSSSISWTCNSEQVAINGENVTFTKTDKAVEAIFTATVTNEGESCTKEFEVLIHANDSTPQQGERALDINGLGYVAKNNTNLIDKAQFDYTCTSYTGWTSGGEALNSNFSVAEGYNDCDAIYAASLGSSSAVGSINPYIPLPDHTGEETFILSFAVYSPTLSSIEWSNAYLCDADKNQTSYILGKYNGTDYKNGVNCSSTWTVNRVAFTPKATDKYVRIAMGWASDIGIDNISIVEAEELIVEVGERYITNETAYDEEPEVLGYGENTVFLQYGENYVSTQVPESITVNNTEYVLVTDKTEKWVNIQSGENEGQIVFDYRYINSADAFVHPGALNTLSDLERIAEAVANEEEPYLSGYNALIENTYAQIGTARAVGTVIRGGTGDNCALLYRDAHRAYLCAIRWKISGDTAYADCARDILNAWSASLKSIGGNSDRYLASGLYGYELACAAEIMRDYEGFELERMQDMLMNVFYPMNEQFLYSSEKGDDHNYAHIMNYWANWDLCNMASSTAIGVFCDRRDIFERALEYYKFGAGNGSVFNAVPKVYEASEATLDVPVGQWQESGRDMEHTMMGVGLMAVICEIAWNQGDDLYGWANNRFMYGAEYVAQYHAGVEVPYTTYYWYTGSNGTWSEHSVLAGQGGVRPVFEMIYNHYKNRRGMDVPGIKALLETDGIRPEGGAGSHASSFDQFGFGTLLYTRDSGTGTTAKLPEGNVPDGVYRITSRKTGGAITADSDGYAKQYAVDENSDYQLWRVKDIGGGVYTVTNKATGKVLSIENDSYDLRGLLTTSDYEGKFSQQFGFMCFEDERDIYYEGYYRIVPFGSGLSLDVRDGNSADGTDILQYTYNSGHHQQWELTLIELEEPVGDALEDIYIVSGNNPILPESAIIVDAAGNEETVSVEWNTDSVSFINNTESVKTVNVTGDAGGVAVSVNVNIYPEVFELEDMYSRNSQGDADANIAKFPVSIEDEFVIEMDVTWNDFGNQWIMLKNSSNANYFGPDQIEVGLDASGGFRPVNGNGSGGRSADDVTMKTLEKGVTYRMLIKGDASTDKYTVILTAPDGEIIKAENYGFRRNADLIDSLAIFANQGSYDGAFYAENIKAYCNKETVNVTVNYTDGTNTLYSKADDFIVGAPIYDIKASDAFYIKLGNNAYIASAEAQARTAAASDDGKTYDVVLSIKQHNAVLNDTYATTTSDYGNRSNAENMLFVGSAGVADAPDVDDDENSVVASGATNVGSARIPIMTFNVPEDYEKGKAVKLYVYVAQLNGNLALNNEMKLAVNIANTEVNELLICDASYVADLTSLVWSDTAVYATATATAQKNTANAWVCFDVTELVENAEGDLITFALYAPKAGAYVVNRERAAYGGEYEGMAAYLEVCEGKTIQATGASKITKNGSKVTNFESFVLPEGSKIRFYSDKSEVVAFTNGKRVYALQTAVEPEEGEYMAVTLGVSMLNGAQVRIGDGVASDGTVGEGSGLRFISVVDRADALTAFESAEIGVEISAESSEEVIKIPAEKWQDEEDKTVFTSAITNLAVSNYNRNFTATPYVVVDGQTFYGTSVTRSIYQVARGLLANGYTKEDNATEADKDDSDYTQMSKVLIDVLNAYVNSVGVRLTFADKEFSAYEEGKGAYTGDGAFFEVGKTEVNGNVYSVQLTPVGDNTIIDTTLFGKYVRINNNNSEIKSYVWITDNKDGTYTLSFDISELSN